MSLGLEMRAVAKRWLVVLIVMVASSAVHGRALAQTPPSQYFPLTGHTVRGEFLDFFNAHGGLEMFGYPITEEFTENGRQVQYFQRMRLDLYPENAESLRVRPGPIGELLGRGDPPLSSSDIPAPGDPNHHYFAETGHAVSYAFLNFFNQHGGVEFFGWPITEYKWENGRIVQYFQCARLEWYPDMPPDQRVRLGNLGDVYALARLDPALLRLPPADIGQPTASEVVLLNPIASLQWAVTGRSGQQTLHVYVVDQRGRPVRNANVVAIVHFPSGEQTLSLTQVNERGHTATTFELEQLTPGQRVSIDVRVGFGTVSASTRTSFLVWW